MSALPRILVATDRVGDARLVKALLSEDFAGVLTSTDPECTVQDFEQHRPDVLVLAFDSLEKAERYYLGLYRLGELVHGLRHRTVILCGKDELQRVYELCKKEYFDDYVLFWPTPHDGPRLPMAVHHALRQLRAETAQTPSPGEFAAQARRLPVVQDLLEEFAALAPAGPGIDVPERAARDRRRDLGLALETTRALQTMAERVRPRLLVVDDDTFQYPLLRHLLDEHRFELLFASSGREALIALRRCAPDLILMDIEMPEMDGIETMRRIKAAPPASWSSPSARTRCCPRSSAACAARMPARREPARIA